MRYRSTERPTADVDLLVGSSKGLVHLLVEQGFDVRPFQDEESVFLIRARRGDCLVDLMVPVTDYQELALRRADQHVLTAEDVIIHKLIAGRSRDYADVQSILSTGLRLDEAYLDHWAQEWDVIDRWNALREERSSE
jgi:hypothetical protein